MKNIVDTSVWLEYFTDSKNAKNFSKAIEDQENLLVPVITIYEVFKKISLEVDENSALLAIAHMKQGQIIALGVNIAMQASKLSLDYKLAMTDSIILATAKTYAATIWTQDADFKGIEGVNYFEKKL